MRTGLIVAAFAFSGALLDATAQSRSSSSSGFGSSGSSARGNTSGLASQNLLSTTNPADVSNMTLNQNASSLSAFGNSSSSSGSGISAFGSSSQSGASGGSNGSRRTGQTGSRSGQQQRSSRGQFGQFGNNGMSGGRNGMQSQSQFRGQGVQQYVKPVIRIGFEPFPVDSQMVTQSVSAAFSRTEDMPGYQNIKVNVGTDGVARLSGSAASDHEKKIAGLLLSLEPGVRQVENGVSPTKAAPTTGNDRVGF